MKEQNLPVSKYSHIGEYLEQILTQRLASNPHYSLRAFAKSLNMDTSTLSKIIRGQRKIGKKALHGLGLKLNLKQKDYEHFLKALTPKGIQVIPAEQADKLYYQHHHDEFQSIADWQHYAILEVIRLDHFRPSIDWVAKELRLPRYKVQMAVERLERLGLLERTATKWTDHTHSKSSNNIDDKKTSLALRKLQQQWLEKSQKSLVSDPIEIRNHSSMTVAIDTKNIPEAKELIKKFRREMAALLSPPHAKKERVYNLCISLFPISGEEKK